MCVRVNKTTGYSATFAKRSILLIWLLLFLHSPLVPQTAELVVQTGHIGKVTSAAFNPDGRQIVSASEDGTCKLFDTGTGRELRTLAEPRSLSFSGPVRLARFGSDGKRIFTLQGVIKIWDASNGRKISTIGDKETIETFALNKAGDRLAAATSTGAVKLYDSGSGAYIRDFAHRSNFVWESIVTMAFSPDGKLVAGGSHDRTIKLWDVETGQQVKPPLTGHSHWVLSAAFSPDGKLLASAGADDTIRLWNTATGTQVPPLIMARGVASMTFSRDGKLIISGDGAGMIRLWDAASGIEIRSIPAHHGEFYSTVNSVAVNGDGTQIVSGGDDNAIRLWDLETGKELRAMSGNTPLVTYVGLSPNGKQLIIGSYDNAIKLWNLEGRTEYRLLADRGADAEVMDYSPDGKTIVTTGGGIRLWNAETGDLITTIDPGLKNGTPNSMTFTPDGKRLVTSNQDWTIKLWDVASGGLIRTLFVQSNMADQAGNNVSELAFSPDGLSFVTATSNGKIAVWDATSGKQFRPMAGRANVSRLMFSPDGTEVVGGEYYERKLRFWKVSTGQEVKHDTPPTWVNLNAGSFAFGHLGGTAVKAEANGGKVLLLDARTGKELASVVSVSDQAWVVTTPAGRFDTNKDLDDIDGLHWVLSNDPFTPKPLELFLRQYYEPGLLGRLLRCTEDGNCEREFKPLPPITAINPAQPLIARPRADKPGERRNER